MHKLETSFETNSKPYTLAPIKQISPGFHFGGTPIPSNSVIRLIGEENVLKIDAILKNVTDASMKIRGSRCLYRTQYFIQNVENTNTKEDFCYHNISSFTIAELFALNQVLICQELEAPMAFESKSDSSTEELGNGFLKKENWDWQKNKLEDIYPGVGYLIHIASDFRDLQEVSEEVKYFQEEFLGIVKNNREIISNIF